MPAENAEQPARDIIALVNAGLRDEDAAEKSGLSLRTYQRRKAAVKQAGEILATDDLEAVARLLESRLQADSPPERRHREHMARLDRIAEALDRIAGP